VISVKSKRGLEVLLVFSVVFIIAVAGAVAFRPFSSEQAMDVPKISIVQSQESPFFVLTPPSHPVETRNKAFSKTSGPVVSSETLQKRIVKVDIPGSAVLPHIPSSKKGKGKHDPSIDERLASTSNYLTSTGQAKNGVRVLVYIDPEYFKGKVFSRAISDVVNRIKGSGARVVVAKANPIVALIPNTNVLSAIENIPGVAYIRDGEVQTSLPLAGNTMSEGVYNVSANYAWARATTAVGYGPECSTYTPAVFRTTKT
jgi:hypothetical protein